MLADVPLVKKQVQRATSDVGAAVVAERQAEVEAFRQLPLMDRLRSLPDVTRQKLAVVMMDGGRFQRRDHFAERGAKNSDSPPTGKRRPVLGCHVAPLTHWREDKIGIVLSMWSSVHGSDPCPDFPDWLATAPVVAELARLATREIAGEAPSTTQAAQSESTAVPDAEDWRDLAPERLACDVVASSADAESFGWHLAWKAWQLGAADAERGAFVADGLAVNWTIHRQHFSHMTGILDLMHALSYAWRAAASLPDCAIVYRRFACGIWQGRVMEVVAELRKLLGKPESLAEGFQLLDRDARLQAAVTYYENHQAYMNYPRYRQQGLPLTSSHMESTVKLINLRMKGTEKFWDEENGESLLELRAQSISDSDPLPGSLERHRARQTGANTYRPRKKTAAA